jgi:hypothetical protein
MDMIFLNVFSIDDDRGKRELNPNFFAHYWPPSPPPPTMSTKILHAFSLLGAQAIVMLSVQLLN